MSHPATPPTAAPPLLRRTDARLLILTQALTHRASHAPTARIWGRAPGASMHAGASGNTWASSPADLAADLLMHLLTQAAEADPLRDRITRTLAARDGADWDRLPTATRARLRETYDPTVTAILAALADHLTTETPKEQP